MAIYHLSVKTVQRSKGRSSVAAAAYRSASLLIDDRTGLTHDYTRKSGVDFSHIVGYDEDRQSLWNAVELAEKRKDATTAREYEVALPIELTDFQKKRLVLAYSTWLHKEYGCVVDACIHHSDGDNPHAHILTTTRQWDEEKKAFSGDKINREWSDKKRKEYGLNPRKEELKKARMVWEKLANSMLEKAGKAERIDHRTLEAQGVERLPSIKDGPYLTELKRRAEKSGQAKVELIQLDRYQKQVRRKKDNEHLAEVESLQVQLTDINRAIEKMDTDREEEQTKEQNDDVINAIDAATLHSPNGIGCTKQKYKARLAFDIYRRWVLPETTDIKYVNANAKHGPLLIWSHCSLKDTGDTLRHYGKLGRESIDTSMHIAISKGWEKIQVSGTKEYQEKIIWSAIQHGVEVDTKDLSLEMIKYYDEAKALHWADSQSNQINEAAPSDDIKRANNIHAHVEQAHKELEQHKDSELVKRIEQEAAIQANNQPNLKI